MFDWSLSERILFTSSCFVSFVLGESEPIKGLSWVWGGLSLKVKKAD